MTHQHNTKHVAKMTYWSERTRFYKALSTDPAMLLRNEFNLVKPRSFQPVFGSQEQNRHRSRL